MKRPEQRKRSRKDRAIGTAPAGADLPSVAQRVRYTGSPYHKNVPSFAGPIPQPRPDASICPDAFAARHPELQVWLRQAIENGHFGADWRQGLPHHVWHRDGDVIYEGCLTNAGQAEYHGYPLEPDATVKGLP